MGQLIKLALVPLQNEITLANTPEARSCLGELKSRIHP